MDMEKMQSEQASEIPCHEISNIDDKQSSDTQHECEGECHGCFQFSNTPNPATPTWIEVISTQPIYHNNFTSSEPDRIYYPPKPAS